MFAWLKSRPQQYSIDGFYLDNGAYGTSSAGPWYETYNFFRLLWKEWGEDLHLLHHNSVVVCRGYEAPPNMPPGYNPTPGLRAIMVDSYAQTSLAGEVGDIAKIADPRADYLRYYTCSYGFSQVQAAHKRLSVPHGALSEQEKVRVVAANLNGIDRALMSLGRPGDDPVGNLLLTDTAFPVTMPLVQEGPLSPTEPVTPNYIEWLRSADYTSIETEDLRSLPGAGRGLPTLLFCLLRHTVLLEYARCAHRVLVASEMARPEDDREPALIDITAPSTSTLGRAVNRSVPPFGLLRDALHKLTRDDHPEAARLEELATNFDPLTATLESQRRHHMARLQAALGNSFTAVVSLTPDATVPQAFAASPELQGDDPLAAATWLLQMSRVRERSARRRDVLGYAEATSSGARLELAVAQLPHNPGERWVALPLSAGTSLPSGRV